MRIINWFQIPAVDMERAVGFYQELLKVAFHRLDNETGRHAFFAFETMEPNRTGGEIIQSGDTQPSQPSQHGVLIYFNAPDGVDSVLSRVEAAGGRVLLPKTPIGEGGVIALILDSEGNRIGLHSMQ